MKLWPRKKKISTLSPLEGYNRWASSYQGESNPIKNFSDSFVENNLPDLHDKFFADAGCGTGKFCSIAEKHHAKKIMGIDLSPAMIEIATTNCKLAEFKCGDLSKIVLEPESHDVIVCALVLGHLEHLRPALSNLLKALKSGGTLIVTDFHPFLTMLQSKRTFLDQRSGKHFEVRHYLHMFEEYFNVFNEFDVTVQTFEEPIFNSTPVIFGIVVRKK
jgi:malonyl-CoA O-methyltransferase